MRILGIHAFPHEGGGFQLEIESGDRHVEIHLDEPCTVAVLTDVIGRQDSEPECEEYAAVEGQFPMLPAVEAINTAITWVKEA